MISYIGCFTRDFTVSLGVKLRHGSVDSTLVAPADRDFGSFIEQHLRNSASDSASRTGDEANFVGHIFKRIRAIESEFVRNGCSSKTRPSGGISFSIPRAAISLRQKYCLAGGPPAAITNGETRAIVSRTLTRN